jgi:hypothetical protein
MQPRGCLGVVVVLGRFQAASYKSKLSSWSLMVLSVHWSHPLMGGRGQQQDGLCIIVTLGDLDARAICMSIIGVVWAGAGRGAPSVHAWPWDAVCFLDPRVLWRAVACCGEGQHRVLSKPCQASLQAEEHVQGCVATSMPTRAHSLLSAHAACCGGSPRGSHAVAMVGAGGKQVSTRWHMVWAYR